ncbi:MAG TPA: hypothetical protein VFA56_07555 [Gaiellaceae bacterium]|nr:hypothetical protein [Gaiellaceae bacterium]
MQDRFRRALVALAALGIAVVPLAAQGGTFSGDNGPIAYDCGSNVCVVNPDGTSPRTLVSGASDLTWSSDESEIAYVSGGSIVVADNDGSNPVALPTGAGATQPTLSFNGSLVAYVQGGDVYTIPTTTGGGGTNRTAAFAPAASDPAYSPDGTQIAFVAANQVNVLTLTSGAIRQVTAAATAARRPTWSPDGSTLAYDDGGQIFTIAASTTNGTGATIATGTGPVYSPDGTKIALVTAGGQLATVPAAGGTPTTLGGGITGANLDWEAIDASSGPPRNTDYPTINLANGDSQPVVGHTLTSSVGSWEGAFPITYRYQWKRCDAADVANGPCVDIAGATSSFYAPTSEDAGKRLRVAITATNSEGSASQNSEVSAVVVAVPPRVRATPQIEGDNVVDASLTLTAGAWDGSTPITFSYSWRRCNAAGDLQTCVQIAGATTNTYTPTAADIGSAIRVWITGTNLAGSDLAITNHTFPIVDKPHFAPSVLTAPLVGGSVGIGRQLTANVGEFDGDSPIKKDLTWQRCDATGEACHAIPNTKKLTYFPTPADVGFTLRIVVVASNTYGDATAESDPTEPIAAGPPHVKGRTIIGTNGNDYEAGGAHDDTIIGRGGNDTLLGGAGDDRIEGGPGNDVVTGGAGVDHLFGGAGSDTIYAADGERDVVDCGPGRDRVVADAADRTTNCEVVAPPPGSAPAPSRRR